MFVARQSTMLLRRSMRLPLQHTLRALSSDSSPVNNDGRIDVRRLIPSRQRTAVTSKVWQHRQQFGLTDDDKDLPVQEHMPPKHMSDSYMMMNLPFRDDHGLREEYINTYGYIRFGKILEDLDAFAGSISYAHCDDANHRTRPLTIVTASVDHIFLLERLRADVNMRMRGHVTWVGSSSMETTIMIEAERDQSKNEWDMLVYATFVMVARDPATGKARAVNKLILTENPMEKFIYDASNTRMLKKKEAQSRSLHLVPPSADESAVIHKHYLDSLRGMKSLSISDTVLSCTRICFPQDRNIHGKIFGGFLMREAYELAFASAMIFSKGVPIFVAQDDISFKKPVEVGSILNLTSRVILCEGAPHKSFQVQVSADVIHSVTGARDTTNVFHYTFTSDASLSPVVPRTYEESIMYIEGLRRRVSSLEQKRMKKSTPRLLPPPGDLVWTDRK